VAKQVVTTELYYNDGTGAAWHTVPAFTRDTIATSRGAGGEGQAAPPSTASLTLDNRTGDYNPRNPTSPLYDVAGRGTPTRITVGSSVRSITETAGWQPGRNVTGTDAWTKLDGGGLLRRLGRTKTPIRSATYRAIADAGPLAYWPLSDGKDSDSATSALVDGAAMVEAGVLDFAGTTGPAGGPGAAPVLMTSSTYTGGLTGLVPHSGTGWTVDAWVKATAVADNAQVTMLQWYTTGTYGAQRWQLYLAKIGGTHGAVVVADHSMLSSTGFNVTGIPVLDGQWHHVRMTLSQDTATQVTATMYFDGVSVDAFTDSPYTAGNVDRVIVGDYAALINSPPVAVDSAAVAEVAVFGSAAPTLSAADAYAAGTGWAGETAGERFLRITGEEAITASVVGTATDTQPMGPQPADILINVLTECVNTDGGLLFEPRDSLGLAMRTGRDLYNQATALTLDFDAEHVAVPLVPVLDDQSVRNDITANRRGGGSARAVLETGRLSVQDPPDGAGRTDARVDVNTATNDVLIQHANWHLHRGTVDETRWPSITVDLTAQAAAFIAAVDAVDIGDRIVVTNLPEDWSFDDAYLIVLGIRETIGTHIRQVTFTAIPASQFETGIVGANDGSTDLRGQAVDTDLSTLAAAVTTMTGTTLSVASTGGVLWTTDSNDWSTSRNGTSPDGAGLFITVGGETMRVTNITGASSPQTFTVVRAVNGVRKTHLTGAPVHVRYPARIGL
jgi:hypothetical protein